MISVTLRHDPGHLEGIFDKEGDLIGAKNLVDAWLVEQGIFYTKDPIKELLPILFMSSIEQLESTVGFDYRFDNDKDATLFKLRWR